MRSKGRIRRRVLIGCIAFFIILCILTAIQSDVLFSRSLYRRYNEMLTHITEYVELMMDKEDIAECIRANEIGCGIKTTEVSEKMAELQEFLNRYIDPIGLIYLYIVRIEDGVHGLVNVCSATNLEEKAAGDEDIEFLMVEDSYEEEYFRRYANAWTEDGMSFFEEISEWGDCYTACRPVKLDNGETIAMICADVDIADLHTTTRNYILISTAVTVIVGSISVVLMLVWLERNVTSPIMALEESARKFVDADHSSKDPNLLRFDAPNIRTDNEVRSLSNAIVRMTDEMKDYVESIISAEARADKAEEDAYVDSLTHVRTKAAYEALEEELSEEISKGNAEFAITMIDLNGLKAINDTYGHIYGDKYLVGTAGLICDTFAHSPVFRVGGDEFVVVSRGRDYENRKALAEELAEAFRRRCANVALAPWEKYSAAIGAAEYTRAEDETVESVYARADVAMYIDKVRIKGESGGK